MIDINAGLSNLETFCGKWYTTHVGMNVGDGSPIPTILTYAKLLPGSLPLRYVKILSMLRLLFPSLENYVCHTYYYMPVSDTCYIYV